jgi:predicted nucleic acid-binding protein
VIVLDASTLINLANGGVLGLVLSLPGERFLISSVVKRESRSIAIAIDSAVASGQLALIDDDLIPSALFKQTKARLSLDEGETECILAASALGCGIACDDRAGREKAASELGSQRVTGSIGLLSLAAQRVHLLTAHGAYEAYRKMVRHGGFLPALSPDYFE